MKRIINLMNSACPPFGGHDRPTQGPLGESMEFSDEQLKKHKQLTTSI
ncbi:MAG: hypothetical protein AAB420_03765 [Patescibacteria group bacterium]